MEKVFSKVSGHYRAVREYVTEKYKKIRGRKKIKIDISERPISDSIEDSFDAGLRITNRIYNFIHEVTSKQLTVAVTGEWGIGKSSVINLLLGKLQDDPKNIVLRFESHVEGRFEVADILCLFR